jgi:hypothetical protein
MSRGKGSSSIELCIQRVGNVLDNPPRSGSGGITLKGILLKYRNYEFELVLFNATKLNLYNAL